MANERSLFGMKSKVEWTNAKGLTKMAVISKNRIGERLAVWVIAPSEEVAHGRCLAYLDSLWTDEVAFGALLPVDYGSVIHKHMARMAGFDGKGGQVYAFRAEAVLR